MPVPSRPSVIDAQSTEFDLIVVGGGVTGAACARDAALRGLRVLLLEKDDFAAGTSSRSSKLIHGGLRYLETYQFQLVAESLRERELTLRLAPHLTRVDPFLYLVYDGDSYGLGMLNFALTFYDAASGQWRKRRHHMLSAQKVLEREPHLDPHGLRGGGLYYDVLTDDARFTLDIAKGAAEQGAVLVNHVRVDGLLREGEHVTGVLGVDELTGQAVTFRGRTVVNATGPWSGTLVAEEYGAPVARLKPSKGVHIVLDKAVFPLNTAIFLRSPDDGRVTWPTPSLEADRVYIGTTDTEYTGDVDRVEPTEKDVRYLLNVANRTIPDAHVDESHVIGSWAGLRPLIAPAPGTSVGNASREHRVETGPGGMITITGGKLTSNRVMAKHVVDRAVQALGRTTRAYAANRVPISGGDPTAVAATRDRLAAADVPQDLADRWMRHYGANASAILTRWSADEAARAVIAPRGVTVAEVRYCLEEEYCCSLADLMVRRTSLFFWDAEGGLGGIEDVADILAGHLSWTPQERARQIGDYTDLVRRHRPPYSDPGGDHA
ncbi:glycerol-3-phosphate dehydrogenase/oxidase [Propionicicella superfundia]|uniref:glycerol-3-phosphate dehydrogenase/oxidase n=1 Tax=Propionicicella superfundia TaxID=348582 RepID=UPI0003FEB5CC|nr:glycerol-3-phosphate dehydrogenase/oxidase [Propionicicella superfundia]